MDLGDGMSVQLSAMWETLEYEFNGVTGVDKAMAAFGYGNFASSYTLQDADGPLMATPAREAADATYKAFDALDDKVQRIMDQKTLQLVYETLGTKADDGSLAITDGVATIDEAIVALTEEGGSTIPWPVYRVPLPPETPDNPLTAADDTVAATASCDEQDPPTCSDLTLNVLADTDPNEDGQQNPLKDAVEALMRAADADDATEGVQKPPAPADPANPTAAETAALDAYLQYTLLVTAATNEAKTAYDLDPQVDTPEVEAADAIPRDASTAGQNVKVERDAWMVSGKIKMGGPIDFRFSYMDADDLEVSCASCSGDWDETAADAWNVGVFYTMPAGTELRLTYSEVSNDDNGTYGQGISGTGLGTAGAEIEMFAVGIVHWFD